MSDNAIARAVASKVRVAYELETDFAKLVDAAKAGALPEEVAREVLALADRKARRRIHLVDKCGRVVRDTTEVEIAIGALRRKEIEFGVVEGVTQQTVCAGADGKRCPDAAKPVRRAFFPSTIKRRSGRPWVCQSCQRKANGRKAGAAMTPQRMRQLGAAAASGKTPEQRKEIARKGAEALNAQMTHEQRQRRSEGLAKATAVRWDRAGRTDDVER